MLVEGIAQLDTLTVDNGQAVVSPVSTIRYQYRGHLGSSTVEANENGQVISYEEFYPYGASAYRAASSGVDLSLKRYRFTGKERDEETGLDYFGVRYYASWLGRWTSGDPGGFVDGLNLYRYVRNNPVNGIDAEGYSTEQIQDETDPPEKSKQNPEKKKNLEDRKPEAKFFDEKGNLLGILVGVEKDETYIRVNDDIEGAVFSDWGLIPGKFIQLKMPNKITKAKQGDNHNYNQHDHIIAVETYLFNKRKAEGSLMPLSNLTSDPSGEEIRDLDPNVVKAVALKETRAGKLQGGFRKGTIDIMQANVTGDWSWKKGKKLGLTKGGSTSSPQESVRAGIMILYWKGVEINKVKDEKGKTIGWESEWSGGEYWDEAVRRYNGGGDPNYMEKIITHYKALLEGKTDGFYKQEQEIKNKAAVKK